MGASRDARPRADWWMTRSFGRMLVVSTAVCAGAMLSGIYASFWLDSAPAPTIVLVLTALFLAAFAWRRAVAGRAARMA